MTCFKSVLFVALVGLVELSQCLKFPPSFKRCPVPVALDNKPNECLKEAIEDAIKQLFVTVNHDLKLDDFDPNNFDNVSIEKGDAGPIAIKFEFKNIQIEVAPHTKVHSVQGKLSSPKDFQMKMVARTDKLAIIGPYKISGHVLILPIQGEGPGNITFINPKVTVTIKGESQIRNGKEYLKINSLNTRVDPERLYMKLENLYNGEKALGDNTNIFLNENWKDIYGEMRPLIQGLFSGVFKGYANGFLERIQYKNIFITE